MCADTDERSNLEDVIGPISFEKIKPSAIYDAASLAWLLGCSPTTLRTWRVKYKFPLRRPDFTSRYLCYGWEVVKWFEEKMESAER